MIFAGSDDRLHVFQMPRGHAVFAADQGFVSASEKLPISFWNLFLGDGRSVRNAVLRSEERRHTLHLVDDDNEEVITSFAAIDRIKDASDGRNIWRSIATPSGGSASLAIRAR